MTRDSEASQRRVGIVRVHAANSRSLCVQQPESVLWLLCIFFNYETKALFYIDIAKHYY